MGVGNSRKWLKGNASLPAAGCITARLWRNSGARMDGLRKNAMRRAAPRGSGAAAAACRAFHWICTSGGQLWAPALSWATTKMQGLGLAALRRHAPKLQQNGRIARLYRQDPLQQLLKFGFAIGITLTLNLLRQQVESAQVLGVDLDCFAELDYSLRWVPAFALEHTQQVVDLIVLGGQLLGTT